MLHITTLASALFLRAAIWICAALGCARWLKAESFTKRRAVVCFVLEKLFIAIGIFVALKQMTDVSLAVSALLVSILAPIVIIKLVGKTRFRHAIAIWFVTLISDVVLITTVLFVIGPLVAKSYSIPTNAMAPTVLGEHVTATCPECGSTMYCAPIPEDAKHWGHTHGDRDFICSADPRHRTAEDILEVPQAGDRILSFKLASPKRWDIITFDFPEEPSVKYMKRVVGLPGETIVIKDNTIFADGVSMDMPEGEKLRYIGTLDPATNWQKLTLWGSPERPAKLGPDEYFVLGDNTERSLDSRFWENGAPGHASYAVPRGYIDGVVIGIYWPPERFRSFK